MQNHLLRTKNSKESPIMIYEVHMKLSLKTLLVNGKSKEFTVNLPILNAQRHGRTTITTNINAHIITDIITIEVPYNSYIVF